jgi:hypothetical protein
VDEADLLSQKPGAASCIATGANRPGLRRLGLGCMGLPAGNGQDGNRRVIRFIADYGYKRTFIGKQLDLGKMSSS